MHSFTADSVEVEIVVVLCVSKDQETIAQSRCLGLTGTDIYIDNATRLLASFYSLAIIYVLELIGYHTE